MVCCLHSVMYQVFFQNLPQGLHVCLLILHKSIYIVLTIQSISIYILPILYSFVLSLYILWFYVLIPKLGIELSCFCVELIGLNRLVCLFRHLLCLFQSLHVFSYKKIFYKKMSLKNLKTLRKC